MFKISLFSSSSKWNLNLLLLLLYMFSSNLSLKLMLFKLILELLPITIFSLNLKLLFFFTFYTISSRSGNLCKNLRTQLKFPTKTIPLYLAISWALMLMSLIISFLPLCNCLMDQLYSNTSAFTPKIGGCLIWWGDLLWM